MLLATLIFCLILYFLHGCSSIDALLLRIVKIMFLLNFLTFCKYLHRHIFIIHFIWKHYSMTHKNYKNYWCVYFKSKLKICTNARSDAIFFSFQICILMNRCLNCVFQIGREIFIRYYNNMLLPATKISQM